MRTFRALLIVAGLALTGFGLYGVLTDHYIDFADHPFDVLRWAVGGLLLHDGLWLPLVCLAGLAVARSTPVRTGLIVAAAVTAVALPAVLRAGQHNGNPTVLPLPYLRNWLLVLAAIAVLTTIWTVLARRRRRAGEHP
ncbi:hypothetical protein [Kitasatospora sp. GAS204B]|uniref:hypothetical protein n=1 Tax=unclassified Kitasatospora TaxID=2633591 RepID=UPI002475D2D5|nr:hypothetical protein [Kitasatospora sp. GAS204B]MDH6117780.1 hypothetical protein [Kitasatospora sp. GAS204B]